MENNPNETLMDFATLSETKLKLKQLRESKILFEIDRILKHNLIEKPELHNKKDEIQTNHYRIDLSYENIEHIIDMFSDLEVGAFDKEYESTAKSRYYSGIIDKWNSISQ